MDGLNIEFTMSEHAALELRSSRLFVSLLSKERIKEKINNAHSTNELEKLAKKLYICDAINFDGINESIVRVLLINIVDVLFDFPAMRSVLNYIGGTNGYNYIVDKMINRDPFVLKELRLSNVLSPRYEEMVGKYLKSSPNNKEFIAYVSSFSNILNALLLDEEDFAGFNFSKCVSNLKYSEKSGFHPVECGNISYVYIHEIAHLIDFKFGISNNRKFIEYYNSLSRREIENGLSQYATTNIYEFLAEGYAEYKCNSIPRPIATKIFELMNEII